MSNMVRDHADICGMNCTVRFYGERRRMRVYISFGDWDEATDRDTYGVPDWAVFYYANSDEMCKAVAAVREGRMPVMGEDEWMIVGFDGFAYSDND